MISELLTLSNRNKVIVNPICRAIKEFGVIYTEDKDEAKRIAPKELMLVALIADYRSVYSYYSERERFDEVRKAVGLQNDWKPRQSIYNAIARYKSMQESPAVRELFGLKKAIQLSSKFIESVNERLEAAIEDENDYKKLTIDIAEPEKIKEYEKKRIDNHNLVLNTIDTVNSMVEKLDKSMTTLDRLEEKVRKEKSDKNEKDKGGGRRGPLEMPEDSILNKNGTLS